MRKIELTGQNERHHAALTIELIRAEWRDFGERLDWRGTLLITAARLTRHARQAAIAGAHSDSQELWEASRALARAVVASAVPLIFTPGPFTLLESHPPCVSLAMPGRE